MNVEAGASAQEILDTEKILQLLLPEDYKHLLSFANGAAGILGAQELHLFSLGRQCKLRIPPVI